MFEDRADAAAKLTEAVAQAAPEAPVVLALPRGGVPVAAPVAARLGAPLDVLLVRKIGMPGHAELAAGALVEGDPPKAVFNHALLRSAGLTETDFEAQVAEKTAELAERRRLWRAGHGPVDLRGRTAVIVDDGIATGATVRAALAGLRAQGATAIWIAVPVAPPDTLAELEAEADRVICLEAPRDFIAVGAHYRAFPQVADAEVSRILAEQDDRKGQQA
ncbi:MAG: phosphoribosyltransferase [Paracoccaceae bacterium]